MMRTLKVALLVFGSLVAGCYRIKYTTNQTPAAAPNYDQWHHNMIFGLAEISDPVNVSQACPNAVAAVENQQTFVNGLVTWLTLGFIWEPTTVTVTCKASTADAPQSPSRVPVAAAEPAANH